MWKGCGSVCACQNHKMWARFAIINLISWRLQVKTMRGPWLRDRTIVMLCSLSGTLNFTAAITSRTTRQHKKLRHSKQKVDGTNMDETWILSTLGQHIKSWYTLQTKNLQRSVTVTKTTQTGPDIFDEGGNFLVTRTERGRRHSHIISKAICPKGKTISSSDDCWLCSARTELLCSLTLDFMIPPQLRAQWNRFEVTNQPTATTIQVG